MSKNNNCKFVGNLTRDVEIRNTASGFKIAVFGMAINDAYKPKGSEDWVEKPVVYIDLEAWGSIADSVEKLRKGSKVSVDTELKIDSWEDKASGQKRSKPIFKVLGIEEIQKKTSENNQESKEEVKTKRTYTRKPVAVKSDVYDASFVKPDVDDIPF